MIPEPWEFALLALAAFRVWKLLGDDRILDRPRDWLLERVDTRRSSTKWGDFIVCPWCAGFWISGLVYAGWLLTLGNIPGNISGSFVGLGVWFALSGAVGLLGVVATVLIGEE